MLSSHDQPHPALLYAIYLVAAASSRIPAVRSLTGSLYDIAGDKLEECVGMEDRLSDGVECTMILSRWLEGEGRGLEGLLMRAKADA
jgi:hypothetical protein